MNNDSAKICDKNKIENNNKLACKVSAIDNAKNDFN